MLDQIMTVLFSVELYTAIVRMTTPLLLAALGSIFAERSGIVTFSMESMMLLGAVGGIIGSGVTGNAWLGVGVALLFGAIVGLIFAVWAVTIGANQIVSSVALNLGALGLSSILYVMTFAPAKGEVIEKVIQVPSLSLWKIPLLGDIPILGQVFFNQIPLVYVGYLMIPIVWFVLYKTTWGLKVRAVGEHPQAADSVGISVYGVRYVTVIIAGAMSGLSGAFLSIGTLNAFQENMAAGRGFIAYTAIVFGKWEPLSVALGTLLFGAADALQLRLQAMNLAVPYQLMVAFPYLVTFITLVVFVGKAVWPASYGAPFQREGK